MAQKKMPAKRPGKKGGRYTTIVIVGIALSLVAISLLLWGPLKSRRTAEKKPPVKKQETAQREAGARRERGAAQNGAPGEISGVVAIVIDDLGQDLKPAKDLLALPDRITLAIIPKLPQSKKIAEMAHQLGREVLVHIPMEAKAHVDKNGAAVLRSDMTPMEFIATINEDIDSVPGAAGVNNHEGSSLTENRQAMTFLMSELKNRSFFFLDSMTSPKSTAFSVAKEFGIRSAKRDVFLDNDSSKPASIRKQLEELAGLAKKNGRAIGIGHPHPETIAELAKWLPEAAEQGIEVVPVSKLMQ